MENILAGLTNKEGVGLLVAEKSIGFTFVNDYIYETLGYTREELLGHDLAYIMDWQNEQENIDKYLSVLNDDLPRATFSTKFVHKDKRIFTANININNHNACSVVEVEQLKETNEIFMGDLDERLAKTVKEFDSKENGLLIISTKEGISFANKTAYDAFGYKKNEMHGINQPKLFTHSDDLSRLTTRAIAVYTGLKSEINFPVRFLKKDGGYFNADLTLTKHKEDKIKFLIMLIDNIQQTGGESTAKG